MAQRAAAVERKTTETQVRIEFDLDGNGMHHISTGVPFFDHMLTLFAVHGLFNLSVDASGDVEVDFHHTVEDVGIVLGDALNQTLGDRKGIVRYGNAVTPMDDALTAVTIDLSNRPFLVYNVECPRPTAGPFDVSLTKEFFRAFSIRGGMNLHINLYYGENEHHIIESIFKAAGRALDQASAFDERLNTVLSSKGAL